MYTQYVHTNIYIRVCILSVIFVKTHLLHINIIAISFCRF